MSELRSRSGASEECVLRVHNERGSGGVVMWWLDYDGRAVQYGVIPAGSSVDQATYTGHAWRLCDENSGLTLAEYVGCSGVITLRADGSVRVASTPAATLAGFSEPTVGQQHASSEEGSEDGGDSYSEEEEEDDAAEEVP